MRMTPSMQASRVRVLSAALIAVAMLAGTPSVEAQDPSRLVFTPVPRCVVLDTRIQGQALVPGVPRAFDVAGTLSLQGGAADCGVPFGPARAAAIRLVPVEPTGNGSLTVWPYGGAVPSNGAVDFSPGTAASVTADLLLPLCDPAAGSCTRDLVVRADYASTHLVAEVAGYFSPATSYQAGLGLTLSEGTFSVNTSAIQSRVSGSCPAGAGIQSIDAAGSVTCLPDLYHILHAGFGIAPIYSWEPYIAVDPTHIQRRITGTCPSGITYVNEDGSVRCAPRIQTGRRSDATACPTERTYTFPEPFATTPVVVVTPNGLSAVAAPPNSYCVVDSVTTLSFQYCCYGHLPTYVNWLATGVQ